MIYIIIILLVVALSIDFGWNDVVFAKRNEIVFEEKNKEYGAFVIRRDYNRTLVVALLIALGVLVLIVSIPFIKGLISGFSDEEASLVRDVEITLEAPPPLDETEPPPPPPPPPPPVMEQIKFTPPEVTEEEIPEEEIPPPQEKLSETNVGEKTQEGDVDAVLPDMGDDAIGDAPPEIFTYVEQMPEFPGGNGEMQKYLAKNIVYPQMEREAGISGKVYIQFLVDKDGNISEVKVVRGVSGGANLEKEAVRVVKSMPPWKAGRQNGRPVTVQFTLPVNFVLK